MRRQRHWYLRKENSCQVLLESFPRRVNQNSFSTVKYTKSLYKGRNLLSVALQKKKKNLNQFLRKLKKHDFKIPAMFCVFS